MTYLRKTVSLLALSALSAANGCGGTMGKDDGGPDSGPIDAPLGDVALDQAPGSDAAADTAGARDGGADSGTGARDCFPECVAALRRSCQRPAYGAGTCVQSIVGANTAICYSNGHLVR